MAGKIAKNNLLGKTKITINSAIFQTSFVLPAHFTNSIISVMHHQE